MIDIIIIRINKMDTNNFAEKHNILKNTIDIENQLINNSDDFIKCLIKKSDKILDLSELGIVNLNLYIHNNLLKKIMEINISKNLLKNILFIPNHIIQLDISFNKLENINFIKKLTNLKYLNISYNKNLIIEDTIFENLINLQTIEMAGNNLKNISDILFEKLEKLEYLDLAGNNLTSVINVIFPKKIELLNLTYNNIEKKEHCELIKKLKHIIF